MGISGDSIVLNGFRVSAKRAHSIMFAQCTIGKKKYLIDTVSDPSVVAITIEGYSPDENDMKEEYAAPDGAAVKKKKIPGKKCESCDKKKENESDA